MPCGLQERQAVCLPVHLLRPVSTHGGERRGFAPAGHQGTGVVGQRHVRWSSQAGWVAPVHPALPLRRSVPLLSYLAALLVHFMGGGHAKCIPSAFPLGFG